MYNKIRNFSIKEGKRKHRVQDKEERAVTDQAVDPKTRVLLFKLVNGGVLDSVNGVISTGKEAVIMHADGGPGPDVGPETPLNVPKDCAIKVFKTTLNEFKTREKYIRDDYRFKERFSKQNPRKIIHMWAEKELHNLLKMSKGGIRFVFFLFNYYGPFGKRVVGSSEPYVPDHAYDACEQKCKMIKVIKNSGPGSY